jgi:hypothetical protein
MVYLNNEQKCSEGFFVLTYLLSQIVRELSRLNMPFFVLRNKQQIKKLWTTNPLSCRPDHDHKVKPSLSPQ